MWEGSKGDIAIDELSLNLNADQCGKIMLNPPLAGVKLASFLRNSGIFVEPWAK